MEETYKKIFSIFFPDYLLKKEEIIQSNTRFVQYTSAESATNIIRKKEIWLRNVQCMNDYSEVNHGTNCLTQAFWHEIEGARFKLTLNNIFPGVVDKFVHLFDSWLPYLRSSSYIACVSEHTMGEELYGRLSMWRAYGGKRSVALVMNNTAFMSESDILCTYFFPVIYKDPDEFKFDFSELTNRIEKEKEFLNDLGEDILIRYLFDLFFLYALCVKHPGFSEEREWRVVYNPALRSSPYVTSSIESIAGIPQEVHKISLKNIPEENFYGAAIPDLLDRIIIGPNDHQQVLGNCFARLLDEAGCKNPHNKIHYSGIPLRT